MTDRVELVAQGHDGFEIPPVATFQTQAVTIVLAARVKAAPGVNFREGRFNRGDVSSMAVQPVDTLKAVPHQAFGPVRHCSDHG